MPGLQSGLEPGPNLGPFKAALVQMRSGRDMEINLAAAAELIGQAVAGGAQYVQTPEVSNILEPDKERLKAIARAESDDVFVRGFAGLAQQHRIWLHAGSLALKGEGGKLCNRSLLFSPEGKIAARYDKIHLFDIDPPSGESHRESKTYAAGTAAVCAATSLGNFGLAICYDVRFPMLANALANGGAIIITYPSAFTVPTGEAHWHVLLRARAIETGSFVLAAAQGGMHECGLATYGHSLAVSPWGEILAEAGDEPTVVFADIDPAESLAVRRRIPALAHARSFDLKPAAMIAS